MQCSGACKHCRGGIALQVKWKAAFTLWRRFFTPSLKVFSPQRLDGWRPSKRRRCEYENIPFCLLVPGRTNIGDIGKAVSHVAFSRRLIIYFCIQVGGNGKKRCLLFLFCVWSLVFIFWMNFLMEGKGGNKYVGSLVLAFWWGIKITFFWRIELVIFHFKSSATLFEYGCYFKM